MRIVRACSEMGIKSVAIYTDADRHALHVKKADEAYHLGSDPVSVYLNAYNIVNLAVTAGCDALHPGYGFLSENPELAEICARRGIRFIGPNADVIRQELAAEKGIIVSLRTVERALERALASGKPACVNVRIDAEANAAVSANGGYLARYYLPPGDVANLIAPGNLISGFRDFRHSAPFSLFCSG